MSKKSKIFNDQLFINRDFITYTDIQKHYIINELLVNSYTKKYIWYKYTGRKIEHGKLKNWMVKLGYIDNIKEKNIFSKNKFTACNSNSLYVSKTLKALFKLNIKLILEVNKLKNKLEKLKNKNKKNIINNPLNNEKK